MKSKSLNRYISLLILFILFQPLQAEEEIDIWNKEIKEKSQTIKPNNNILNDTINSEVFKKINKDNDIKIENEILENSKNVKIFGIYDPAENNFDLNMWTQTEAEKVRSSFKRINKIELSSTAANLFENTILSFAYPPKSMNEEEFVNLKINWMIENKRIDLIEKFLKQNNTFPNKKKLIQYLVDINIAKANIKEGCDKINFLDKNIKDSYLEKFKFTGCFITSAMGLYLFLLGMIISADIILFATANLEVTAYVSGSNSPSALIKIIPFVHLPLLQI